MNNTNITNNKYNNNSNTGTGNTMTTERIIKVNFQDVSRDVELPSPATLSGLQEAVASTFGIKLPIRSSGIIAHGDLSFTYRDSDGDDIMFDKDSELDLALRLCPGVVEISAAGKVEPKESTHTADNMDRLYRVAARNLREYHGVPSMTPVKLTKTLALFKLCPRRLVVQGLAPMKLLTEKKAPPPEVAAGTASGRENENSEDTTETIVAEMQLMSVEGDKKESSDGGFEAVTNDEASMSDTSVEASNTPEKGDGAKNGNDAKKKNAIHAALLAADIQLKPRETRPLLVALGVNPRRLVRLGVVDGKIFSPMHGCRKGHCPRRGGPARDSGNCQRSLGNPRAVNSNACGPTRRHGACDGTHRHGAPRTGTMLHPPSPPAQVHAGPRCRCACGGPPVAHPHEYGSGWGEMTPMWMGRGMQQRGQARRGGGGGHGHQHFGFYMM